MNLPKHFHSFTHFVPALIQIHFKPRSEKTEDQLLTQLISHHYSKQTVCGQNISSCKPTHLMCTQTHSLLSVSLQEAPALFGSSFRRLCHANELYELCCAVAAFQAGGKKCVTVNVTCLYLPCRVTLLQNSFA